MVAQKLIAEVFLSERWPRIEGLQLSGISMIALSALTRAGIKVARKGSHIFRHSLATQLLKNGATVPEIGQVLRLQDQNTTWIYTKVDIDALRTLSRQ